MYIVYTYSCMTILTCNYWASLFSMSLKSRYVIVPFQNFYQRNFTMEKREICGKWTQHEEESTRSQYTYQFLKLQGASLLPVKFTLQQIALFLIIIFLYVLWVWNFAYGAISVSANGEIIFFRWKSAIKDFFHDPCLSAKLDKTHCSTKSTGWQ